MDINVSKRKCWYAGTNRGLRLWLALLVGAAGSETNVKEYLEKKNALN